MNFRDIIIFLSLFGVFIVLLNVDFTKRQQVLNLCDPYQVTDFQLQNKKGDVRGSFDASVGEWRLSTSAGDQSEGDANTIKTVTTVACFLPYVEKFTLNTDQTNDEELQTFGIQNTKKKFTLSVGEAKTILKIGDTTPSGTEFYLHTSQEPNVIYTVSSSYQNAMTPSFLDLSGHFPFSFLDYDKNLDIDFGNVQLFLKKKDEGWVEENQIVSQEQADELIQLVKNLNYSNYKGPIEKKDGTLKEEYSSYGLDFPEITFKSRNPKTSSPQVFRMVKFGTFWYLTMPANRNTYLLILKIKATRAFIQYLETLSSHISAGENLGTSS